LPLLPLPVQAPDPNPESTPPTATLEKHLSRIAAVHMEANKQAQEIAMELVHNIDEDHRAEWSKLDGMIKHRDEKLQEISVELDAKNAEIQSLVAQRDKNFGLLELMKAKENELNTLLAERETILTNLKVSLQTRDDEILSLKAINDRIIKEKDDMHHRFIKEKEEMPVTKNILNSMLNEREHFYIG
jgi:Skp family chaperone for outer membrane proteins